VLSVRVHTRARARAHTHTHTHTLTPLVAPRVQMAMISVSNASAAAFETSVGEGNHALSLNTSLCANIAVGGTMVAEEDACNIVR
jgi:hypothetical protein